MERLLIDMGFETRIEREPDHRCWVMEAVAGGTDLMIERDDVGLSLYGIVPERSVVEWSLLEVGLGEAALLTRLEAMHDTTSPAQYVHDHAAKQEMVATCSK